MANRVHSTVGEDPARQWHGIYLGRVTSNRPQDMWVKAQVPQVMGTTETNWAAPMLDPRGGRQYESWGFVQPSPPDEPVLPNGPGPGRGTQVLVMFIGGNINTPVYCLLGLDASRQAQLPS